MQFHIQGEPAAIRYFDPHSTSDFQAMQAIYHNEGVQKWMDNVETLSEEDYRTWAADTHESYLFACLYQDAVEGFVYLYSGDQEKVSTRRLIRAGFLKPATRLHHTLEVSFARRPTTPLAPSPAGLMSSALRQACLFVQKRLDAPVKADVELVAFIDPENVSAQRLVEASGFILQGRMAYEEGSSLLDCVYVLNWQLLEHKLKRE